MKVPTFVPDELTSVAICTFFTSALISQPSITGTSTPACSAAPKLLCLIDGCSAVVVAASSRTSENRV